MSDIIIYMFLFSVHLVDIWNMIEAFRDNGLNSLDHSLEVSSEQLGLLLRNIFYDLNKRLPSNGQIEAEESEQMMEGWMLAAYDP